MHSFLSRSDLTRDILHLWHILVTKSRGAIPTPGGVLRRQGHRGNFRGFQPQLGLFAPNFRRFIILIFVFYVCVIHFRLIFWYLDCRLGKTNFKFLFYYNCQIGFQYHKDHSPVIFMLVKQHITSVFFFFFFAVLGFELRAYNLSHSTSPVVFGMRFFRDRVLRTICPGWLWTTILLICAFVSS
jgi:hypothetical protein